MILKISPTGIITVGIIVLLFTPSASAQIPTFEGEEVIVPGKRPQQVLTTPAYVTVIPGDELRRMGFLTLSDALTILAEMYVRTGGSGLGGLQQPSVRGSTPQQVLVLIDGIPLNATAQFGVNLATITLADVERVEVLRGPYSAIHGSFAVIQVVTRRDAARRASASTGSFGTRSGFLRLSGGSGALLYALSAEALATAGYRPNGDASRWTGSGRLVFSPSAGGTLTFSVHHTSGEGGVPGSTDFPSLTDRLIDTRMVLSLEWLKERAGGARTQVRLWWLGDGLRFTSTGFASQSWGAALGAELHQVTALPAGAVLTWGLEWQQASFDYADTFAAFQSKANTAAGYLQYDFPFGTRSLMGVGLRYETHSVYGTRLNPRLGFVHLLTPAVRLRGGIGQVSRAPTFGELFFPGCSNPDLKPERAWAADLGVDALVGAGLRFRLNGFYTDAQDLIVGGCNPQNVGSARVAGLSAELVGRLSDRWAVSTNLTWTDGLNRTTGLSLLRVPPFQANLVLRYAPAADVTFSLLASYVSDRPDLDFSTFPATRVTLPPYVTVGLRLERPVGSLILRVGIDNLFDAQYEPLKGFPAPGRAFWIQLAGRL